jgi:formylglycine-generating enzyme required for sulfatase activity
MKTSLAPRSMAVLLCRGGAWSYSADRCRSTSRAHPDAGARESFIGFRRVRVPR